MWYVQYKQSRYNYDDENNREYYESITYENCEKCICGNYKIEFEIQNNIE